MRPRGTFGRCVGAGHDDILPEKKGAEAQRTCAQVAGRKNVGPYAGIYLALGAPRVQ